MNHNFLVNVSVVIFDNKGRILLGHRSVNEDVFPNLWCIPGGKVDNQDTSLEAALQREVNEEVGIEIKNIELVNNNIRAKKEGQFVVYLVYKAKIFKGRPEAKEDTDEVKWFEFQDINPSTLTPFTYDFIRKAVLSWRP